MSNLKAAWARIRERVEQAIVKAENGEKQPHWLFGPSTMVDPDPTGVKSIHDEIQDEYRADRITEPERDAMRQHVKAWLGDPAKHGGSVARWSENQGYDAYSCGLWAPTAAPWGFTEYYLILGTLVVLEEESE